nr:Leucine-rich repeat-containing protein [Ipomoea batatas]
MGFLEMEPIFGQLKAEWSAPHTNPLRPFLLHVHGLPTDPPALRFHVTDFHSNTWEALKTEQDLEDMRDVTGIGGSWSDFLEYVLASIKSDDVKLVLEGDSVDAARGKLIAQKAKGMPRITILLSKLVDAAASEAVANLSLELYKSLKNVQNLLISEQERCCHLSKAISVEQEKNETIQKQLDGFLYPKRQKLTKVTDKSKSDPASIMDSQNSPDGKAAQQPSTKVINRVVPTRRRAKVRGVLLQDTEDDAQN